MAAVLSRNLNDIKKTAFFMDECKRMGIKVLGPNVNESHARFMVNKIIKTPYSDDKRHY